MLQEDRLKVVAELMLDHISLGGIDRFFRETELNEKESQSLRGFPVYSCYLHEEVLADASHFILHACGSIECYEI
jgi:hypothetical protein